MQRRATPSGGWRPGPVQAFQRVTHSLRSPAPQVELGPFIPPTRLWPPYTPGGNPQSPGEGPGPDGIPKHHAGSRRHKAVNSPVVPGWLHASHQEQGLGDGLDSKHPLNKYSIVCIKEPSKDQVTCALPCCRWDSYKWLMCGRNGLFSLPVFCAWLLLV